LMAQALSVARHPRRSQHKPRLPQPHAMLRSRARCRRLSAIYMASSNQCHELGEACFPPRSEVWRLLQKQVVAAAQFASVCTKAEPQPPQRRTVPANANERRVHVPTCPVETTRHARTRREYPPCRHDNRRNARRKVISELPPLPPVVRAAGAPVQAAFAASHGPGAQTSSTNRPAVSPCPPSSSPPPSLPSRQQQSWQACGRAGSAAWQAAVRKEQRSE